ncbi:hypothetical protein CVT25_001882 [Psilocybe cyanescens]|uniref:protein-L-isoaspartate(D-aspartate) O-methyltransferase n=1 Tax=Psilocybe cyanescens TaxID=93625 RepID=A0A409WQT4_PSICY|nr:hypothetical protein CVT25_001882 [Psilocybe cyanescens]
MAWSCTGKTNSQLVSNLKTNGIIRSERVVKAMNAVDRANYVSRKGEAYLDSPQFRILAVTLLTPVVEILHPTDLSDTEQQ